MNALAPGCTGPMCRRKYENLKQYYHSRRAIVEEHNIECHWRYYARMSEIVPNDPRVEAGNVIEVPNIHRFMRRVSRFFEAYFILLTSKM